MMNYLFVFLFISFTQNAIATTIYKCINRSGISVFSDEPCSKKAKRIKIRTLTKTKSKVRKNGRELKNLKREKQSIIVALATEGLPNNKKNKLQSRLRTINKQLNIKN